MREHPAEARLGSTYPAVVDMAAILCCPSFLRTRYQHQVALRQGENVVVVESVAVNGQD